MTQPTMDKLIKAYLNIRAKRSKMAAEFKEADEELKVKLKVIEDAFQSHCAEHGLTSIKTDLGTAYRTEESRYFPSDWGVMYDWLKEKNAPELLEKRLNQSAIKDYMEEHPDEVIPSLRADTTYRFRVRKTT